MYLNSNSVLIALGLISLGVLYFWQKQSRRYIPFAFLIALLWTSFFRYEYVNDNLLLLNRINLFPLVLWTLSLTLAPLVYDRLPKRQRFAQFLALYWVILWTAEFFGQHALDVHLNSGYPDLLGLGVLHLPGFGQFFYVAVIPLFVLVIRAFDKRALRTSADS